MNKKINTKKDVGKKEILSSATMKIIMEELLKLKIG
jgi:hypothetical protein